MNLIYRLFPRSLEESAQVGNKKALRRYLHGKPKKSEIDNAFLTSIKTCQFDAACILFENGADINTRDINGNSALHYVCSWQSQNYYVVKWLINHGANVNSSNNDGMTAETGHTPLFEAASSYDFYCAKLLLDAGADPNALSPDGSPLHRVCSSGFKYSTDIFENYGGNIVSLLLSYGADPNLQDEFEGKTSLHAATDFSHPSESVKDRYLAVITLLLAYGADPLVKDSEGKTPLYYAEKNGHVQIAEVLRQAMLPKPM